MNWTVGDRVIVRTGSLEPDYAVATITKVTPKTCKLKQTPQDIEMSRDRQWWLPQRPAHESLVPYTDDGWRRLSLLIAAYRDAQAILDSKRRDIKAFVAELAEAEAKRRKSA